MYVPKKFKAPSPEAVIEFIQKYPFATLVCEVDNKLEAVHIPLTIQIEEDKIELHGHIAKANKLGKAIEENKSILTIFSEPHAYVSSSWYDHVNVPTWNYIAIHIYGQIEKVDEETMIASLKKMVDQYEEGRENRYHISDMPEDMLKAHLAGLVAFKIEVEEVEANFKLSQNRNNFNYQNIIQKLKESDLALDKEIANEMEKLRTSND